MPKLLTLPYAGIHPHFSAPANPSSAATSAVLGRVTMGCNAFLASHSVIRADGDVICIGDDFAIGSNATVHIAHERYPTRIGNHVTMEDHCVAHACEIGSHCLLQRGAVVLDGAVLADDIVLSANALVFPRARLQSGWVYAGQPARAIRKLGAEELNRMHRDARARMINSAQTDAEPPTHYHEARRRDVFLATTCGVLGKVLLGRGVNIWYGCYIDANCHRITLGEDTNVQDNTRIECVTRSVDIGSGTTIGHNASLTDCSVGSHSLIGIGSVVSAGTQVQDEVILAAGARTEPGQILTTGHIWAGCPARPLKSLDASSVEMIRSTPPIYAAYAEQFATAQRSRNADDRPM